MGNNDRIRGRDWENIFRNLAHPMAILDANQNVLAINDILENKLGKRATDLKGAKCWKIFHGPETQCPPLGCPFVQMRSSDKASIVEMPVEVFNGIYVVSCTPIYDENGQLDKVVHIATDITEQKKAEDALKEIKERYQALFDRSLDIVYIHDFQGQFIDANEAALNLFGYKKEEIPFYNISSFLSEDQLPLALKTLKEIIDTGVQTDSTTYRVNKRNGEEIYIETMGSIVLSKGLPAEIQTIARDITSRRHIEEQLHQSETRYRALVETSPDAIIMTVLDGTIIFANPRAATILGYTSPSKMLGGKAVDTVAPECRANLQENIERAITKGDFQPFESEFLRVDGGTVPVEMSGAVIIDTEGRPQFILGTARDITERKRLEGEKGRLADQLQQAMKMEAVGRLAGGVAHEFNNLLQGIIGDISLILMDLNSADPMTKTLTEINRSALRAAMLVRQLLAFSRKALIEPKVIDLNGLIMNLHKMLSRLIGEDIELNAIPGQNLGAVKMDPGQIEQILINLAVNARDAMPEGGRLTIETSNVELDEEYCYTHANSKPGRYVMLSISDTGIGMNHEVKQHLFEPFFTTKPMGSGTGLGLATIYGAVKQSEGSIEAYSEVGSGTTFKIYLPMVAEKAKTEESPARIRDLPRGTETVLVVEDEDMVRQFAVKILTRLGYKILQAPDGNNALVVAEEHKGNIDLLFTDVVMPKMNGRQLADKLKTLHPETVVLFASGYTENVIVHQGVVEGHIHFIGKPYSPQAIANKVREVLDGKRQ